MLRLGLLLGFAALLAAGQTSARKLEPVSTVKEHYPNFSDAEAHLIADYFRPGSGHKLPESPKKDAALTGIEKQLRRGGIIAEAALKLIPAFPEDLDKKFPKPPEGYGRFIYGSLALLVKESTGLVVDILPVTQKKLQD